MSAWGPLGEAMAFPASSDPSRLREGSLSLVQLVVSKSSVRATHARAGLILDYAT